MAQEIGRVTEQWQRLMSEARRRWDKLTEADVDSVRGNAERLVSVLQSRYGFGRDQALRELGAWRQALVDAR